MIPVAGLVGVLPTVTLQIERAGAPSVDSYGRTTIATALDTIEAVVHPASPERRERLPEADRDLGVIDLTATVSIGLGDVVTYQGERWRVLDREDYLALGGVCMALATRIEATA